MNESVPGQPRSMRERELELENAHLAAELEALRGADPAELTSRFLSLAASTVDLAIEDARREADAHAAEVSADAETRRDEATRLAAEAEERTEVLRSEADNHAEVVAAAQESAARIKAGAEEEARSLVATERTRVAEEIEALAEVRVALEDERGALESYHEELRRRVQELAGSMVSFMTTEPPLLGAELDEALPSAAELPPSIEALAGEGSGVPPAPQPVAQLTQSPAPAPALAEVEPAERSPRPWIGSTPGSAAMPTTPVGVILDMEDAPAEPASSGLFGPATEEETELPRRGTSLFGTHGARLIEQMPAKSLADVIDDTAEDERFRSFISGDDADDPSRDWLLRPE